MYDASLKEIGAVNAGTATTPQVNCGTTAAEGTSRLVMTKGGTYVGYRQGDTVRFEFTNCLQNGVRLNGYYKLTLLNRPTGSETTAGYSYLVDSAFTMQTGTMVFTFAGDFNVSTFYISSAATIPWEISISPTLSSSWRTAQNGTTLATVNLPPGTRSSVWRPTTGGYGFVNDGTFSVTAGSSGSVSYRTTSTSSLYWAPSLVQNAVIPTQGQAEFQLVGVAPRVSVTASGTQCTLRFNSRSTVTTLDSVITPTCASLTQ